METKTIKIIELDSKNRIWKQNVEVHTSVKDIKNDMLKKLMIPVEEQILSYVTEKNDIAVLPNHAVISKYPSILKGKCCIFFRQKQNIFSTERIKKFNTMAWDLLGPSQEEVWKDAELKLFSWQPIPDLFDYFSKLSDTEKYAYYEEPAATAFLKLYKKIFGIFLVINNSNLTIDTAPNSKKKHVILNEKILNLKEEKRKVQEEMKQGFSDHRKEQEKNVPPPKLVPGATNTTKKDLYPFLDFLKNDTPKIINKFSDVINEQISQKFFPSQQKISIDRGRSIKSKVSKFLKVEECPYLEQLIEESLARCDNENDKIYFYFKGLFDFRAFMIMNNATSEHYEKVVLIFQKKFDLPLVASFFDKEEFFQKLNEWDSKPSLVSEEFYPDNTLLFHKK